MSETIVLKKGLNIPVNGEANLNVSKTICPDTIAIKPGNFKGMLPRLLVKEGDRVLAGSPVLADKKNPAILVCSPVSGTVQEIVRGEKRKLLAVLVSCDDNVEYVDFGAKRAEDLCVEEIKDAILAGGLWPMFIQRPYGVIADPEERPRAIFISGFNTAPLSPDMDFTLGSEMSYIQKGIDAVARLTDGGVHLSINAERFVTTPFRKLENVILHQFKGKHPAGNVGVQIANIWPVKKDNTVWTISLLGLAMIGKLFATGRYQARRKAAVTGPMAIEPSYVDVLPGTPVRAFAPFYGGSAKDIRFIDGDILSGEKIAEECYTGYNFQQLTIIREGNEPELFGWIRPLRYKQFSTDHCYFSWLTPWRKYDLDTNLHGGPRAFVMSDSYYSKVLPMDIYPLYLTKACLAGDIDQMEKFGIYEVLPEDLALCEYVDPSKNNIQDIIAKGIDLMLKEMA